MADEQSRRTLWQQLGRRKLWAGLIGVGILLVIIIAGLVIHDVIETRRLDRESVALREDLTVEYDQDAQASDFLTKLDGELVEDKVIATSELGTQEVEFEYINLRGRKRPYRFTVQVVDRTAPVIYGRRAYTVERGYAGELTDLMLSGDELDDQPQREIQGEYDVNRVGDYALTYMITDASGNTTQQKFTLHVIEPVTTADDTTLTAKRSQYDFAEAIDDYKTGQTKLGIDVSSWQGEINWQKVKQAGVEFAFIRLGYQKDYDGDYVLDKYFRANIEGARAVGLPVGVYFYSYAKSEDDAKAQAAWIKEQIQEYEVELGVAFDWENWADFNQAGMSFRTINRIAQTFMNEMSAEGYQGLLYGSKNYLETVWQPAGMTVWLAQYNDRVTYEGDYKFWQLSDRGKVEGIEGEVDVDLWLLR